MPSLKRLIKSFKHAFKGLFHVLKTEQNFRIQLIAALAVIILSIYFRVKPWEAVALILVILMVLVLELLNSIFERLVDILKPRVHYYIRVIKDIMAATVLLASLAAIVIGLIIFWPYFTKI